jgi:hypothetical protein
MTENEKAPPDGDHPAGQSKLEEPMTRGRAVDIWKLTSVSMG